MPQFTVEFKARKKYKQRLTFYGFFFLFFTSLFRVKIEISPNTGIIELLFKRNSVLVIVLQQLHD